ncbi:MAG: NAD(P)-dependent alcohol dehydrogenase [Terricaulis sp.]
MRAAIVTRYGSPDVIEVRDVPKPVAAAGELLVRVHAATVNRTDCGELAPHPPLLGNIMFGLTRPRRQIFGLDFAGVVAAVGVGVTAFKLGDRVCGMCPFRKNGAHAEYVCVPSSGAVALVPDNVELANAVVCEGAYYADAGLKQFSIGPSSKVMVYGASGAIGSAAVQLAKAYGAKVTAVVATPHLQMARSLGADHVVDYTREDFTRGEGGFDYVFDAVGKESFFRCRRLLKPDGAFASTDMGPGGENLMLILWSALARKHRVSVPLQKRANLPAFMSEMRARLQDGKFRAVVDRRYPLESIADAYRYVETGQKVGIVVIDVAPERRAA